MGNFLTPITTRIKNAREGVGLPQGMEISMNADGSGGAVPEKNPSPAKCWETHKQVGMKTKGGKRVPNCVPK